MALVSTDGAGMAGMKKVSFLVPSSGKKVTITKSAKKVKPLPTPLRPVGKY